LGGCWLDPPKQPERDDPARKLGLLRRLNVCGVLPGIAAVVVKAVERDGEDYADEGFGLKVACLAIPRRPAPPAWVDHNHH